MFDYDSYLTTPPEEKPARDYDKEIDDAYDRYIDEQLGIL